MASLRASLAQLEKIARAGLVDEDMPRCVHKAVATYLTVCSGAFRYLQRQEVS